MKQNKKKKKRTFSHTFCDAAVVRGNRQAKHSHSTTFELCIVRSSMRCKTPISRQNDEREQKHKVNARDAVSFCFQSAVDRVLTIIHCVECCVVRSFHPYSMSVFFVSFSDLFTSQRENATTNILNCSVSVYMRLFFHAFLSVAFVVMISFSLRFSLVRKWKKFAIFDCIDDERRVRNTCVSLTEAKRIDAIAMCLWHLKLSKMDLLSCSNAISPHKIAKAFLRSLAAKTLSIYEQPGDVFRLVDENLIERK